MSKCSTKSSGDKQEDDPESIPELMPTNTRLTPRLGRLRPRTAAAGAEQLAGNSGKSSTSSSTSGKKRKEDETEDENIKAIPKKKKPRCAAKKHLNIFTFFLYQKIFILSLVKLLLPYDFFVEDYTRK